MSKDHTFHDNILLKPSALLEKVTLSDIQSVSMDIFFLTTMQLIEYDMSLLIKFQY